MNTVTANMWLAKYLLAVSKSTSMTRYGPGAFSQVRVAIGRRSPVVVPGAPVPEATRATGDRRPRESRPGCCPRPVPARPASRRGASVGRRRNCGPRPGQPRRRPASRVDCGPNRGSSRPMRWAWPDDCRRAEPHDRPLSVGRPPHHGVGGQWSSWRPRLRRTCGKPGIGRSRRRRRVRLGRRRSRNRITTAAP